MARDLRALYRTTPRIAEDAPLVLVWSTGGTPMLLEFEATIGAALRMRGIRTHFILCDGPFNACIKREIQQATPISAWKRACADCVTSCMQTADSFGMSYSFLGDYVPASERRELAAVSAKMAGRVFEPVEFRGTDLTKSVASGVIRYMQGKEQQCDPAVVREYAFSALVGAAAADAAIKRWNPTSIFMSHGMYVDWGPALRVAETENVPVMLWQQSYVPSSYFVQRIKSSKWVDPFRISDGLWTELAKTPLNASQEAALKRYLESRYSQSEGERNFRVRYGLSGEKPTVGVFGHINWDAVADYGPMLFPSFTEWFVETIKVACENPDVNWLIKIHPWEVNQDPNDGMHAVIRRAFAKLPPHVQIIGAADKVFPLDVLDVVDIGITVFGTAGLELAARGKPVVLAGEPHYSRKGFTFDSSTAAEYLEKLKGIGSLRRISSEQQAIARNYAYNFFLRRQVPLSIFDGGSGWITYRHDQRAIMAPGVDAHLDFYCSQIVSGGEGLMPLQLVETERQKSNRQGPSVVEMVAGG